MYLHYLSTVWVTLLQKKIDLPSIVKFVLKKKIRCG